METEATRIDTAAGLAGFGSRMRAARLAAGLSQSAIAAAGDWNHSLVSRWEGGKRRPTYDNLFVLAAITGVSAAWLLTGEGVVPQGVTVGEEGAA